MKINFDFNFNSFTSGFAVAAIISSSISAYWLIAVFFLLFAFEIKGMPYAKLTYKSGEGWKFTKGRY